MLGQVKQDRAADHTTADDDDPGVALYDVSPQRLLTDKTRTTVHIAREFT